MAFYLLSLFLLASLPLFIASSSRGTASYTQTIQSAVKIRETDMCFRPNWVLGIRQVEQ